MGARRVSRNEVHFGGEAMKWMTLDEAKASGKLIMVDFHSPY